LILSDAFCLSSVAEGIPISLIECFAIGRIPICTPAGGVVDMISNNENGFVSADFTLLEFVACLKEFIFLSSEKKIQMIENIKRDSHKYTISHCAEQYERCFEIFSGVN
jgi:glycogen synthase